MRERLRIRNFGEQEAKELRFLDEQGNIRARIIMTGAVMQRREDFLNTARLGLEIGCDDSTVRRAVKAFNFYGPKGLKGMGRPRRY